MPTSNRVLIAAVAVTLSSSALSAPAPVPAAPEEPAWGKAVKGLRLGVRRVKAPGAARLMAVIENVGENDLVLNLGVMLANGKRQLPTAVRLSLTGGDGKTRSLERKVPGVGGRVDPFVVPLAAGCRYEVRCDLAQFGPEDADGEAPAPGRYRVAAAFVGAAVTGKVNGDSGPGLMSYWAGTVRSAEVEVTIPAAAR